MHECVSLSVCHAQMHRCTASYTFAVGMSSFYDMEAERELMNLYGHMQVLREQPRRCSG